MADISVTSNIYDVIFHLRDPNNPDTERTSRRIKFEGLESADAKTTFAAIKAYFTSSDYVIDGLPIKKNQIIQSAKWSDEFTEGDDAPAYIDYIIWECYDVTFEFTETTKTKFDVK